jgi:predicted nucleotidyltransferase
MKIEDRLGNLMMRKVDVLTPKAVKPYMRDAIERSGRRIVL